jgi:hypothetical protein
MRNTLLDYDQGPTDSLARVNSMMSILEDTDTGFRAPSSSGQGSANWKQLQRTDDQGEVVLEDLFKTQLFDPYIPFEMLANGGLDGSLGGIGIDGAVPEPGTGLLVLAGAGLLMRRRRK